MKLNWFEDWGWNMNGGVFTLDLPNASKPLHLEINEKRIGKKRYEIITSVLMSAFDQIQRDNGGYRK